MVKLSVMSGLFRLPSKEDTTYLSELTSGSNRKLLGSVQSIRLVGSDSGHTPLICAQFQDSQHSRAAKPLPETL